MGSLTKGDVLSVVALVAVVVLAVVGSIGGDAAVTFIGGLLLKNPASSLRS